MGNSLTIVVTGASGFIGSALSNELICLGMAHIIPVSRTDMGPNVYQVNDYEETPEGDVLIHTAEDANRADVNRMGAAYIQKSNSVIEALISKRFDKVIYCSSSVVYGDHGGRPYSEENPVNPHDIYTRSKLNNENKILVANGIVVRISNVVGYNMSVNNVFSDILKQLSGIGDLKIQDGSPVRDFIWIDDVVSGVLKLIHYGKNGIYNIGSGQGVSIDRVAMTALEIAGQSHRRVKSLTASQNFSFNALNIGKMKRMYNWQPIVDLHGCLQKLITLQKEL